MRCSAPPGFNMHVNILNYATADESQLGRVKAVIRVVDGKIQVEGEMHPRARAELERLQQIWAQREPGDEAFLRSLTWTFGNTYNPAQFVK
jgi:hypothetical protein